MNIYSFEKRVSQYLNIPFGSSVLAAVSGGIDSMCMLHALCSIRLDLKIYVAHVNFNLRGEDSFADQKLVESWCKEQGIELFVNSVDTLLYCKQKGISMEMGARELRYNWFESLIKEYNIEYLFTAHNANDNAETILINLLRGSGIKGMCGIGEYVQMNGYSIVRPILSYTRDEIEKYVLYHKVPYRVDKTNLESDVVRNKLRNLVFPVLNKINPSSVESINRSIKYMISANEVLSSLVESKKDSLCISKRDYLGKFNNPGSKITGVLPECTIDISMLEKGKEEFWIYSLISEYGFGGEVAESLYNTLYGSDVKRFVGDTHIAIKERGFIKIYYKEDLVLPVEVIVPKQEISGEYKFGKKNISLKVISPDEYNQIGESAVQLASRGVMVISLKSLDNGTLSIRGMKKGDSFVPYGMKGTKKISDFLTDLKVDNATRELIPLLCCNNKIVSVIGNRIDANFAVTKGEPILLISISSN